MARYKKWRKLGTEIVNSLDNIIKSGEPFHLLLICPSYRETCLDAETNVDCVPSWEPVPSPNGRGHPNCYRQTKPFAIGFHGRQRWLNLVEKAIQGSKGPRGCRQKHLLCNQRFPIISKVLVERTVQVAQRTGGYLFINPILLLQSVCLNFSVLDEERSKI